MDDDFDWYQALTPKEREVLEMYACKHSYKAVASALGKSPNVVDQQLLNVRRKMGVCSMAEAMYMLAGRHSLAARSPVSRGTQPLIDPAPVLVRSVRRPWFKAPRAWLGAILAGATAALALAVLVDGVAFPKLNSDSRSISVDALAMQIVRLRQGAGRAAQRSRAVSVSDLCERAWAAMWGPQEDHVLDCMTEVAPDIRRVLVWARTNDPDLAVQILGDGHRLFSRIPSLSDWPDLLDRALSAPFAARNVEYGRALCGVAFARWHDDPMRGYKAANLALTIFQSLPAGEWDQANAMRHMGLCCPKDFQKRMHLYRRALAIFRAMGDVRGIASTELSMAQAGAPLGTTRPPPLIERQISNAVRASELFRALKNMHMLNEAIGELERSETPPVDARFAPLRKKMRTEFLEMAEARFREEDVRGQRAFLCRCLRIDFDLADAESASRDIESMLLNPMGRPTDMRSRDLLTGFDDSLRHRLGLGPDPRFLAYRLERPAIFRRGMAITPASAVQAAESLDAEP